MRAYLEEMEWERVEELVREDKREFAAVIRNLVYGVVPVQMPSVCFSKEGKLCVLSGAHGLTGLHEVDLFGG